MSRRNDKKGKRSGDVDVPSLTKQLKALSARHDRLDFSSTITSLEAAKGAEQKTKESKKKESEQSIDLTIPSSPHYRPDFCSMIKEAAKEAEQKMKESKKKESEQMIDRAAPSPQQHSPDAITPSAPQDLPDFLSTVGPKGEQNPFMSRGADSPQRWTLPPRQHSSSPERSPTDDAGPHVHSGSGAIPTPPAGRSDISKPESEQNTFTSRGANGSQPWTLPPRQHSSLPELSPTDDTGPQVHSGSGAIPTLPAGKSNIPRPGSRSRSSAARTGSAIPQAGDTAASLHRVPSYADLNSRVQDDLELAGLGERREEGNDKVVG